MSILTRLLTRQFLGRWLGALLALTILLQLLDLLDNATDVLARGGGGLGILRYTLLRMPSSAERLIPLAALIAAVLTFSRLASGSEAASLRALGVSGHRMVACLLPACFVVAVAQFGMTNFLVPATQRSYANWWASLPNAPAEEATRVWFRAGPDVASADRVRDGGRLLEGVTIIRRDASGHTLMRLDAAAARHGTEGWQLQDVRERGAGDAGPALRGSMAWPDAPTPRNLLAIAQPIDGVSLPQLRRILDGQEEGWRGTSFYRSQLQERAAALLSALVMVLLAFPVSRILPRRGGGGVSLGFAILAGLAFVALAGATGALGEAGLISPALAAWTAPVLFGCLGCVLMLHLEG
ncbi:LptF/LptG family permease [Roseomonas elaeocarpi]|uniref:LptF/LptG family permease n=1 Tax=Roseomonas elaeocarpi TaxID=907779 RepID=A0ABV6JUN0_9PROT